MAYSELLFLAPTVALIPAVAALCICFAALFVGKRIFKIEEQDITTKRGSFMSFAFTEWAFAMAAFYAALIVMFFVSKNPFFEGIHSEWGVAPEKAYVTTIYIACMAILHTAFFSLSYIYFKKAIGDKIKRLRLFISLVATSTIVWAVVIGVSVH